MIFFIVGVFALERNENKTLIQLMEEIDKLAKEILKLEEEQDHKEQEIKERTFTTRKE